MLSTSTGVSLSARRVLLVALALALSLAGCSTEIAGDGSLARTVTTETPPGAEAGPDEQTSTAMPAFAAGLLPAAAFGPDAVAEPLLAADRDNGDPRQLPDGAVWSDPECATSSESSAPEPDSYAGQSVIVGSSLFIQSVQSPFEGTPQDPRTYADGRGPCQSGTLTLADGSTVTLTFTTLGVGELGDLRGGRRIDSAGVTANGLSYTSAVLTADVVDGERVCSLGMFSLVPNEPVDENAFRELVAAAFQYQHDALG
ncbi:MAG: hypothetical protein ACR2JK_03085 [Geodermatophilaceae bacterium]